MFCIATSVRCAPCVTKNPFISWVMGVSLLISLSQIFATLILRNFLKKIKLSSWCSNNVSTKRSGYNGSSDMFFLEGKEDIIVALVCMPRSVSRSISKMKSLGWSLCAVLGLNLPDISEPILIIVDVSLGNLGWCLSTDACAISFIILWWTLLLVHYKEITSRYESNC